MIFSNTFPKGLLLEDGVSCMYLHDEPFLTGICITSAASGSVCGFNSVATMCDSLSRVECACKDGFETEDGINCTSK